MLGKNNFNERLRKMEMQAKQDRFSIRKLSIGAASVLLGFTFFGMNSQSVQADSVPPAIQVRDNASKKITDNSENMASKNNKKGQKLDTYKKLNRFLRDSDSSLTVDSAETSKQTTTDNINKDINSENSVATSDKNSNTTNKVTNSNNVTLPIDTNKPAKDEVPANTDMTGTTDKPVQKPIDTTDAAETSVINSDNLLSQDQKNKAQIAKLGSLSYNSGSRKTIDGLGFSQTTDATVYIGNWKDFSDALGNKNITDIRIIDNILADNSNADVYINIKDNRTRNLVIESDPDKNQKFVIDFSRFRPCPVAGTNVKLNLTYSNLTLYSGTFYGVAQTSNVDTVLTFDNIDFHGSQMVFSGGHDIEIHFKGNDIAEDIMPYHSILNGADLGFDDNYQQLFEFNGGGAAKQYLYFDEGCTFVGKSTGGNVIEMNGTNAKVQVGKGAQVTLDPAYNAGSSLNSNNAQNTSKIRGIYIGNSGIVEVEDGGVLNINVGNPNFNGTLDNQQAAAITLDGGNSQIIIDSGGTINVNTNGDVSNYGGTVRTGTLIYDAGNIKVNPNATLNITGTNMWDYSGTLLYIAGNADLENGIVKIQLIGDGAKGSGTGESTLIDIGDKSKLTVNNPQELIMDASKNKNANIIGSSNINIMNVRQEFDFPNLPKIVLPPFHILNVGKSSSNNTSGIIINRMELLNGKKILTKEMAATLQNDLKNDVSLAGLGSILNNMLNGQSLTNLIGSSFDKIFPIVIQNAFSNQDNPGYNYIHMLPANPTGFLNIKNAKAVANKDGSRTITGSIIGYDNKLDGPDSDTVFNRLIPGGTDAYVVARFRSTGSTLDGKTWKNPNQVDSPSKPEQFSSPYQDTDLVGNSSSGWGPVSLSTDSLGQLPTEFAAKVNDDGTFSFTIPTDICNKLLAGAQLELTPEANFVEYDEGVQPYSVDLLKKSAADTITDARNQLDQAYQDALNILANSGLDSDGSYKNNIDQAYKAAVAGSKDDTNPNPDKGHSIYGVTDNNSDAFISEVTNRTQNAIDEMYHNAYKGMLDKFISNKQLNSSALANEISAEKNKIALASGKDAISAAENAAENNLNNLLNKAAAAAAISGAADKARQDLGVAKGSKAAAKIDQAEQDALAAINKVTDGKYETAENTGLANVVEAEKTVGDDILASAESAAETAIDKTSGLSAGDKDKAKQAAQGQLTTAKGEVGKVSSADVSSANVTDKQNAIKEAVNAGKNSINSATGAASDLGAAKQKAKENVSGAAASANKAVDQLTNHADGTPYTAAEKQALKDAIQAEVDKANGTIDQAETNDKVTTAANDAIDAINKITEAGAKNDNSVLGPIFDTNAGVSSERKNKAAAAAAISGAADKARQDLGVAKGSKAAAKIDQAEQDALAAINKVTDGKYETAENTGLANVVEAEKTVGDDILASAESAAETAIDKTSGLSAGDKDKAKQAAQGQLTTAKGEVGKVSSADVSSANVTDKQNAIKEAVNAGKNSINSATGAASDLGAAKQKAKENVSGAAASANKAVDQLTNHADGTPYTAAEKQALKDAIQAEVDKANGTIDQAETNDKVTTAANDAIDAINKITEAGAKNDNSVLGPIFDTNAGVSSERKNKAAAAAAISGAADKARQDLGVAKGSKAAAKIDQAEQDALAAINKVTDGKYETAENTGLANVVEAEKTVGDDILASAESAAETAIDKTSGLSAGDKDKAKQAAQGQLTTAKGEVGKVSSADVSSANVTDKQNAIKEAVNAGKNSINSATGAASDLGAAKQKAKENVSGAAASANKAVDQLTNHADGTPYTAAEKQALKDAIQAEVDKANGTIDQAETNDKVTTAANDAIDAINKITEAGAKNDNSVLGPIFDTNAGVSSERKNKAAAAAAISGAADKARQDLGVAKGSKAAAKIDQAEQDALAAINKVTDGKYETAENTGLANVVEAEKTVGDDILASAESAAETAIDKTSGLSAGDKDKAKQAAQGQLTTAKGEVGKVSSADVSSANVTDKQNAIKEAVNAGKNSINSATGAASDLGAAKQKAKENVSGAAASANKAVDQLTNHADGTPYTAAEKQALKDAIQAEVDKANGTIDQAETNDKVTTAANDAIDAINKITEAGAKNDNSVLGPIFDTNAGVSSERKNKAAAAAAISGAADKARQDLGVAKGSKAAAKIDQAEQDALAAINKVTDGKYETAENTGLANVVEAEKTVGDDILASAESAAETAIDKTSGLSAGDKDKAKQAAQGQLTTAKGEVGKVSSADVSSANVTDKQNAIKEAVNAGKNSINSATGAASDLGAAKQKAKENVSGAAASANKAVDQLTNHADGTPYTAAEKQALKDAIQAEVDKANGTIDQAETNDKVTTAANDAIDAINKITEAGAKNDNSVLGPIFDTNAGVSSERKNKAAAAAAISGAADKARQDLGVAKGSKAAAKIDQAEQDALAAINKVTDGKYETAENTGLANVVEAEKTVGDDILASAESAAETAIDKTSGLSAGDKDKAKQAAQGQLTTAKGEVGKVSSADVSSANVTDKQNAIKEAVNAGKNSINSATGAASDLGAAKQKAKENVSGAAASANKAVDQLTNHADGTPYTAAEKQALKDAIQAEVDKANGTIDQAETNDKVTTAANDAIDAINKITEAGAKNDNSVLGPIFDTNAGVSSERKNKAAAAAAISGAADKARQDLGVAKGSKAAAKIDQAEQDALAAINKVTDGKYETAENTGLANVVEAEKTVGDDILASAESAAETAIDKTSGLSAGDKDKAKQAAQGQLTTAKGEVGKVSSADVSSANVTDKQNAIKEAVNAGKNSINSATGAASDLGAAKQKAKENVSGAAASANKAVDQLTNHADGTPYTAAEKQALKDAIQAEVDKANGTIDQAETNDKVTTAANDAIDAINKITEAGAKNDNSVLGPIFDTNAGVSSERKNKAAAAAAISGAADKARQDLGVAKGSKAAAKIDQAEQDALAAINKVTDGKYETAENTGLANVVEAEKTVGDDILASAESAAETAIDKTSGLSAGDKDKAKQAAQGQLTTAKGEVGKVSSADVSSANVTDKQNAIKEAVNAGKNSINSATGAASDLGAAKQKAKENVSGAAASANKAVDQLTNHADGTPYTAAEKQALKDAIQAEVDKANGTIDQAETNDKVTTAANDAIDAINKITEAGAKNDNSVLGPIFDTNAGVSSERKNKAAAAAAISGAADKARQDLGVAKGSKAAAKIDQAEQDALAAINKVTDGKYETAENTGLANVVEAEKTVGDDILASAESAAETAIDKTSGLSAGDKDKAKQAAQGQLTTAKGEVGKVSSADVSSANVTDKQNAIKEAVNAGKNSINSATGAASDLGAAKQKAKENVSGAAASANKAVDQLTNHADGTPYTAAEKQALKDAIQAEVDKANGTIDQAETNDKVTTAANDAIDAINKITEAGAKNDNSVLGPIFDTNAGVSSERKNKAAAAAAISGAADKARQDLGVAKGSKAAAKIDQAEQDALAAINKVTDGKYETAENTGLANVVEAEKTVGDDILASAESAAETAIDKTSGLSAGDKDKAKQAAQGQLTTAKGEVGKVSSADVSSANVTDKQNAIKEAVNAGKNSINSATGAASDLGAAKQKAKENVSGAAASANKAVDQLTNHADGTPYTAAEKQALKDAIQAEVDKANGTIDQAETNDKVTTAANDAIDAINKITEAGAKNDNSVLGPIFDTNAGVSSERKNKAAAAAAISGAADKARQDLGVAKGSKAAAKIDQAEQDALAAINKVTDGKYETAENTGLANVVEAEKTVGDDILASAESAAETAIDKTSGLSAGDKDKAKQAAQGQLTTAKGEVGKVSSADVSSANVTDKQNAIKEAVNAGKNSINSATGAASDLGAAKQKAKENVSGAAASANKAVDQLTNHADGTPYTAAEKQALKDAIQAEVDKANGTIDQAETNDKVTTAANDAIDAINKITEAGAKNDNSVLGPIFDTNAGVSSERKNKAAAAAAISGAADKARQDLGVAKGSKAAAKIDQAEQDALAAINKVTDGKYETAENTGLANVVEAEKTVGDDILASAESAAETAIDKTSGLSAGDKDKAKQAAQGQLTTAKGEVGKVSSADVSSANVTDKQNAIKEAVNAGKNSINSATGAASDLGAAKQKAKENVSGAAASANKAVDQLTNHADGTPYTAAEKQALKDAIQAEVDKANGTIDQAETNDKVTTAANDAIDAINKITEAGAKNDNSVLGPIFDTNAGVSSERKNKAAAAAAISGAADKARQDLGVAKGSKAAAKIDQAEQDALAAINKVTDGKYETAENTGLANVVEAEKTVGDDILASAESAAETAIDKTSGLSAGDKDKAKQAAQGQLTTAKGEVGKVSSADVSSANVTDKQNAIKEAVNAGKNSINSATGAASDLGAAKQKAKENVSGAAASANKAVDQLTNHADGTPYTAAEKQALKDAIQAEVDKANGTIDQAETNDKVTTAANDAIDAINKITEAGAKNDNSVLGPIFDTNAGVSSERKNKAAAAAAISGAADKARQDLGVAKGSKAAAKIDQAEQDALAAINKVTDGKYETAENTGLANVVEAEKTVGDDILASAESAAETAIDKTSGLSAGDKDKAKQAAQGQLTTAKGEVGKVSSADVSSANVTDKQNAIKEAVNAGKNSINSATGAASDLGAAKQKAKENVSGAAASANKAVDQLTNHADGTPYTAAEKQALKDAIQAEVDKANGTIDQAETNDKVTTAANDAIDAINKITEAGAKNDNSVLGPIFDTNAGVSSERKNKAAAAAAISGAADKARQDLGVAKGSKAAAKIDQAEQDALAAINKVTDGKYETAENTGLANVVEAEKTVGDDILASAESAAETAIDKTSGLSAGDKDKAKQAAQGQLTTAKGEVGKVSSADVSSANVTDKQNAIKEAVNAGKNSINSATGAASDLGAAKQKAKENVSGAAASANKAVDQLTNHADGTPYTAAEKQALKDAIQAEVDKANGTIDQAETNDKVTTAANDAIDAINKITEAGAKNDNSVLGPIFDTNAGVSSERKNKAAAAAAISGAADKARQDLGVAKGSKAAAKIDQAEQDALAAINKVTDGKYETAENTGLANVVEAEKTVGDDILASAESAAETAIDKTSGLSAGDKDKAKQAAQGQLTTAKGEVGKVSSADVSSANVTDKQNAIKEAVNAGKNSINSATGAASDLGAAKQKAKENVSGAAASANKAVDQLTNHADGTPYTAAEKQALKDAIQAEVDKANGTIDQAETNDKVTTAANDAIDAINKITEAGAKNDNSVLGPIFDTNAGVSSERKNKAAAAAAISGAADKARQDLGVAKGSKAAAKIDQAEQDALAAINKVTDGKYETAENTGLANVVEAEKTVGDDILASAESAAETAIDKTSGLSAGDKDKAKQAAQGQLTTAKGEVGKVSSADVSSANVTDKQNAIKEAVNAGKNSINSATGAASDLGAAKQKAKENVSGAAASANKAVDQLTNHADGTPYTAAEKQALKDAIQAEVDKANGTIDQAETNDKVTTAANDAIDAINKITEAGAKNDNSVLGPIFDTNAGVSSERKNKAAAAAAISGAADKARQDLGVAKGSKAAAKIDQAEQDALAAINKVTDGKYETAENTGLANVVEAEKTVGDDILASAESAAETAIDKTSGLSAGDKDKAKQAAQGQLTTAKGEVGKVSSADVSSANVTDKQNAIKEAVNAGKNSINSATGAASDLGAAKQKAKENVSGAAASANKAVDQLTNHADGTPYTAAEKQALKDAIQAEVDKANGTIDQAETNDKVTTAANDAIDAINKITEAGAKNDNSVLGPIFDTNAGVSSERKNKAAAAAAISGAADKARQDLGVAKGSKAAAKIDQAEQDALAAINKVTDGKYETAENTGLANVVEAEKTVGDDILASAESAAETAIDKTSGLSAGDKDKAKQAAQGQLTTAKGEVGKVSSADVSSANVTDKQNAIKEAVNAGKNSINSATGAASDLGAAKQKAKENVSGAAASANKAVDQLTNHADGTPYTAAEKQALKDAIQAEVDKANGTIDQAETNDKVTTAANDAIDAINKITEAGAKNDNSVLGPIFDTNAGVSSERKNKAAAAAAISGAADKARQDLGVAKGSKAAAKIDQAEQDALAAINKVTDGKYETAENTGLANVVEAEKTVGDDILASAESAAETAIDKTSGLSAGDKDKAKQAAQGQLTTAKGEVGKVSSADVSSANVTDKQNAIKEAVNAGKNSINSATGAASDLGAAKQKAKEKLTEAYQTAKQKLGANSDFSALDRSYQAALNNLQGESDDELNKSELAGERLIGKGAVQSAYDTAAKKIEQMWPDDNSQTAKDKKNALLVAAQGLLDEANEVDNGTIDQAHHSTGVSDARNDAIDKIKGIHSDKDTINNIIDNDKVVQIDKAHDTAVASGADQHKVQQIRDDTAKQIKHDLQTGDKEAAKEHELAGEKEIAKLTVQGVAANAKGKIDHLTNKPNGTPYTDTEKQALKDKVDKEIDDYVTQGDQAITASDTTDKVNKAKDDAINNINNAISDSHLADILSKDPNVAKTDAENAIDHAVTEANTAIDNNKNWSKEQKDKLKDKVKQDAQAGKDKIKHDSDIDTINQDKDSTIGQIKNDYTAQATINTIINGTNNSSSSSAEPVQQPVQHSDEGEKDLILMHNAYLYDENGKRANMVDLKAGSVVETYGKEKIGDKDYFVLIDHGANDKKYYVVCTNINGIHTTLKHNAYVYDEYGQRIKSRHAIKAGTNIATFGDAVTIRGIKYYIIGENKFVRATNVSETADTETVTKTAKVEATVGPISDKPDAPVQKKIMHNAYAYNDKGVRANGLIFSAGTVIPTTGAKSIDGVLYYELDDGMYIKAANIDAKKLRLQHNAYIYSQYGNREGKRVLKKHKLVKTYGDPISIHGKKYYITAKGKFVKKANFNKK
ncbi:DUF1542 domain-containing protein [Lactobacillus sp. ESL0680]|uniref:DUF1542 domain-containing protein n=1 Tax=Lactobacillus sp. ESL0680 TaxID=2983210 RepID=UPI0023F82AC3|nr:DUF1542 domain-containing protein [Lactobacillus sp. ESL0680]WEV39321.1 DUF1542 domain-containing protein [Lactobacillus sp. ESL0680]